MSFIFELLSGALVGGAIVDKLKSQNWGSLLVAFDPKLFGSSEQFTKNVQQLVDRVKSSQKEEGVDEILLPGERGSKVAGKFCQSGIRLHTSYGKISDRIVLYGLICSL